MDRRPKAAAVTLSGLLLLLSFTQTAFYSGVNPYSSISCFAFGWFGIFFLDSTSFIWLANPLFISACIVLFFNTRLALLLAVAALFMAAAFLSCHTIAANEAGYPNAITAYGAGYWLWLSAIMVLALSIAAVFVRYEWPRSFR